MSFHGAGEGDVEHALLALKTRLSAQLGDALDKLALYGSRARGDHDPGSDIDIAIVVCGMDTKLKAAVLDTVADVELEYLVPLSALVLSREQFSTLKARERRIALDIEQEGIPL